MLTGSCELSPLQICVRRSWRVSGPPRLGKGQVAAACVSPPRNRRASLNLERRASSSPSHPTWRQMPCARVTPAHPAFLMLLAFRSRILLRGAGRPRGTRPSSSSPPPTSTRLARSRDEAAASGGRVCAGVARARARSRTRLAPPRLRAPRLVPLARAAVQLLCYPSCPPRVPQTRPCASCSPEAITVDYA